MSSCRPGPSSHDQRPRRSRVGVVGAMEWLTADARYGAGVQLCFGNSGREERVRAFLSF